jgi:predicted nucleic acid-binding protein
MSVLYDAGVLVAAERGDRRTWADHRVRLELGLEPLTTAPVVAQVSRSPRQVQLRRFLRGCGVVAFTAEQAHEVGALLADAVTSDVVDAHLAVVAGHGALTILTSDPDDIRHLSSHLTRPIEVRPI